MSRDQIGKDPSVFFPNSIGKLIKGCEARETSNDTRDAYKKGTDSKVNPRVLR